MLAAWQAPLKSSAPGRLLVLAFILRLPEIPASPPALGSLMPPMRGNLWSGPSEQYAGGCQKPLRSLPFHSQQYSRNDVGSKSFLGRFRPHRFRRFSRRRAFSQCLMLGAAFVHGSLIMQDKSGGTANSRNSKKTPSLVIAG